MASSRRLAISSLLCDDNPPFSPLDALAAAATEERRRLVTDPPPPDHRIQQQQQQQQLDRERERVILDRRRFEYEREQREYEHRKEEQQRKLDDYALLARELEHREFQRREIERRELEHRAMLDRRDIDRRDIDHRELERRQPDFRDFTDRDLDRRRDHMRQNVVHAIPDTAPPRFPILTSPHPPTISHLISHSPRDRPHQPQIISLSAPSHDDPRPIKKRRYSESPTRPIPDDKERIAHERDKMHVGELGYGRTDSPVAGPSHPPRRPGSGNDHSRKVAVADLLTVDKERSISSSASDRDPHRVLSPLGRRSPPGSQAGRAKAARKSDDHLLREPPPPPPPQPILLDTKPKEEPKIKQEPKQSKPHDNIDVRPKKSLAKDPPPPPPPKAQPVLSKSQQDDDAHEWFLQQFDEEVSPTTSTRHEPPHSPSPSSSPVITVVPPPIAKTPPPPRALTPIKAAVSLEEELEELVSDPVPLPITSIVVKKQDPDIDMEVDLAVTELVDTLEADDAIVKHEPKRMEVDVEDELLSLLDDTPKPAPTSSSSTARRNPPSSAAPVPSTSHTPVPTPSSVIHSHAHPHPHSHAAPKQPPHQNQNRSTSEAPHVSPVVATAAAPSLSPVIAARHPSTRPASERGSMPPPASTTGPGKKGADRAGSAVPPPPLPSSPLSGPAVPPPATAAAPTAGAAKKKKETKSAAKSKTTPAPATGSAPAPAKKARPPAKKKGGAAASAAAASAETASAGRATPPATSGRGPKGPVGTGAARKTAPSTSRSRSASVMPGRAASGGPESDAVKVDKQEEEESDAEANEDDKLYCVCKTRYDEDRFMIACDRCDEWYHTQCVKMPDLEVDLVDQFICPLCIEKYPHLNLRTTYKTRCLYGLRHPDPSSTRACHKAARGAFSKYCSDECGVKYMQSRVDSYAKKGGKPDRLWESVKNAEKREGVVCAVDTSDGESEEEPAPPKAKAPSPNGCVNAENDTAAHAGSETKDDPKPAAEVSTAEAPAPKPKSRHPHVKTHVVPPTKSKITRETERLNNLLDGVIKLREDIKHGMEIVVWRERLLQLASARAEAVGQCGWDQRLCMDDEEWAEHGDGVLESYDDAATRAEAAKEDGGDAEMEVDAAEWWCPGNKVCDRHQGWQAVRHKDVCKEKEKIEEALAKLTTREREIRKRIEDMLDPQTSSHANGANATAHSGGKDAGSNVPLKSSNVKPVNGHSKTKATTSGDAQKKGKKRKAPAS